MPPRKKKPKINKEVMDKAIQIRADFKQQILSGKNPDIVQMIYEEFTKEVGH